MEQDLFSETLTPAIAPSYSSYPVGSYAQARPQQTTLQHPGGPLPQNVAPYPGFQLGASTGANLSIPAYPGVGIQQFGGQAATPAYLPPPAMAFPIANGSVVASEQLQPLTASAPSQAKFGMTDSPDPFSTLVPGFKAALPGGPAVVTTPALPGFVPGEHAGGFGAGFGTFSQGQVPTNGQIPALHASAPSSFGTSSGSGGVGAKSGNPFA